MNQDEFLNWLSEVLAVQSRVILVDDRKEDIEEWDSLGSLLLLMRLEEDFGVVVDATEIESLESVRELYELYSLRHVSE